MTLEEKLKAISTTKCSKDGCSFLNQKLSDIEIKLLSEQTYKFAIEFVKWCEIKMVFSSSVIHKPTYDKLLLQFKKEKGI